MTKALARVVVYKPSVREVDGLRIVGYEMEEKEWTKMSFRSKLENLVNRMAIEASRLAYSYREENSYTYAYIIAPGLMVFEGEGETSGSKTILYPVITRLDKIKLLKKKDSSLEVVKEYDIGKEFYIYDGWIELREPIDYDALLLETETGSRILLKEELYIPTQTRIKSVEKEKKKKAKKKRKTKTKKKVETKKKEAKKTTRKKKKSKRKKKTSKSRKKRKK